MEDFGSPQHMSLPESTLQQAIVNTQVGQRFGTYLPRSVSVGSVKPVLLPILELAVDVQKDIVFNTVLVLEWVELVIRSRLWPRVFLRVLRFFSLHKNLVKLPILSGRGTFEAHGPTSRD